MALIIVSKSGGVFSTRAGGRKNYRGEVMGTEDMIRHLCEVGHRVVYFGVTEGDVNAELCLSKAQLLIVEPHVKGMSGSIKAGEQEERWTLDEAELRAALQSLGSDGHPPLWIESCGLSASVSFVRNPRAIRSMLSHVRYSGPMLAMMSRLRASRACFVADVRSYPRNVEMSDGWPELRPMALLDNWAGEVVTDIAFVRYRRRSVQSRSYSWGYLDWVNGYDDQERHTLTGVSHCHVATGFKKKHRREAWHQLLGPEGEMFDHLLDARMYGEGWDEMPELGHEERFFDPVSPSDVWLLLQQARVTPVVAPSPGYVTNKAYIAAANGCLPVTCAGHDHEWDPEGHVLDRGSVLRCEDWTDVRHLAQGLQPKDRYDIIADLRDRMKQDFSVLDAMIDDWENNVHLKWPAMWWEKYGGFVVDRR